MTTPINDLMASVVDRFTASQLYARERDVLIAMMGTDPSSTTLDPNRIEEQMHRTLAALRNSLSLRVKPAPAEESSPLSGIPDDVLKAFAEHYRKFQESISAESVFDEAIAGKDAALKARDAASNAEHTSRLALNGAIRKALESSR